MPQFTGVVETKKAASYEATLLKRLDGGNQRKLEVTPFREPETDNVRCRE
jgi:hypothetical protein